MADENPAEEVAETQKLKPCCACPETKKVRDACIVEKGEEHCDNFFVIFLSLVCVWRNDKCSLNCFWFECL
ncbi:cytochrome c oxidase copper chaperone [Octopus vulgaris]|uniref:Cytochrome c oxidase copper chaperone n=1 Tax=Octopus vulgaris TaxID=6645 RepID=A0AA36AU70_OCTVU|nr:cytochrome c oxidase copper chaperone [Octopus vulgaris]